LLPYIDQANVESAIQEWQGQQREFQDLIFISTYICPTDPYADRFRGYFPSYRVCNGSYRQKCGCCDGLHYGCDNSDAFFVRLKARDVTDGMSQTAAITEKLVHIGGEAHGFSQYASDHPELWIRMIRSTAIPYLQPDDYDRFANECEDRALPMGPVWVHDGVGLLDGNGPSYNHVLPPNRNSCFNGDGNSSMSAQFAAITATSAHDGGVNVLMADGAVKFASDKVDRTVWRPIGTRNGGEPEANGF
jgi:prepilin-type processing-associated H-X9-DG protein